MVKGATLVTAYKNPDLDGIACTYGYAEFLKKTGFEAIPVVFGIPHREANFVLGKLKEVEIINGDTFVHSVDKIILVDASDLTGISKQIDSKKVVEIIDHRKVNEASKFTNAKIQIELVGAAATLVAEKFYKNKVAISKESALLLYSAIISNTINFKAGVTTDRDHKMAKWLNEQYTVPKDHIHKMFLNKSEFTKSLDDILVEDLAIYEINAKHLGISQLEIVNVNKFVNLNIKAIKGLLEKIKENKSLDYIFLTCVDIEKGFNKIVLVDHKTEALVSKVLQIRFNEGIGETDSIFMRKEIVPRIKDFLKKFMEK